MLKWFYLLLFSLCFSFSIEAKDSHAFNIKNIYINEAFENVSNARDNALKHATSLAFEKLFTKLTNQSANMINLDDIDLSQYVLTYDIKHEKISRKHYEATFTIHFNPEMIRHFFKTNHIAYSEIQIQPTLIIPVFNEAGTRFLWEQKTDWFKSWQDFSHDENKIPLIIPNGDIHDLTKLTLNDLKNQNFYALRNIMQHYNATLLLVSEMQPISNTKIIVKNKLYNFKKAINTSRLEVTVTDSLPKTYTDIQNYILNELWHHAKDKTLINDHEEKTFNTNITINSLKNLVDLEKKLQSLNIVKSYHINSISSKEVNLTIYYIGTEDTLRNHIFSF